MKSLNSPYPCKKIIINNASTIEDGTVTFNQRESDLPRNEISIELYDNNGVQVHNVPSGKLVMLNARMFGSGKGRDSPDPINFVTDAWEYLPFFMSLSAVSFKVSELPNGYNAHVTVRKLPK